MDILDRLFSREIKRRTGAHAIKIDADLSRSARKRTRMIGAKAIKSSSKVNAKTTNDSVRSPSESKSSVSKSSARKLSAHKSSVASRSPARHGTLFHRIDVRFPWLKLIAVLIVGIIATMDLLDFTISKVGDLSTRIRIAPMSQHVRATERVLEGKKLIALTFDDGPSAVTTPALLDTLSEKDVLATFFMLGNMARSNPDLVKRIEKEHHEIASHTTYHQNLISIPAEVAKSDIDESKSIITDLVGHPPLYTRPPYGNLNDTVVSFIDNPIILWSVDSEDWKHKDQESIVKTVMAEVYDGGIILMHDIYPTTVETIPAIIDRLRSEGYEFVTISELSRCKGISLTPKAVYYNILP